MHPGAAAPERGQTSRIAPLVEMRAVVGDLGPDRPRRLLLGHLESEPPSEFGAEPRSGRLERNERAERVEQNRRRWGCGGVHAAAPSLASGGPVAPSRDTEP